MLLNPNNCSNLLAGRNLQKQVKKTFCYQKLFWPFTDWINFSSDLKNSRPSASNFKSFSQSLEQFFLTVGQNNFGNKIPFFPTFLVKKFNKYKVSWIENITLWNRDKYGRTPLMFSVLGDHHECTDILLKVIFNYFNYSSLVTNALPLSAGTSWHRAVSGTLNNGEKVSLELHSNDCTATFSLINTHNSLNPKSCSLYRNFMTIKCLQYLSHLACRHFNIVILKKKSSVIV